jgi:Glycerate kinase family
VSPRTPLLVASGPFGAELPATRVTELIAGGLRAGGQPAPDLCPLPGESNDSQPAQPTPQLLEALDFDARMRSARAVIVGVERLDERTLIASLTFEIATRARQSGVPAYAVTAENHLNAFDARILDLQLILQARGARALSAAGRKLAELV